MRALGVIMYKENKWTVLFVIWGILLIVFSVLQLFLVVKILFTSFALTSEFFMSFVVRVLLTAITFYFGKKLFNENVIYSHNAKLTHYYQKLLSKKSTNRK